MNNLLITEAITALMPMWLPEHVTDIQYLRGGYSNDNYAFHYEDAGYVIRVPQISQPYVDRWHEQAWYQALPAGVGLKPTAFDAVTGRMISPWLEGQLLIEAWPDLDVDDLISYLVQLHKNLPKDARHYNLVDINRAYWSDKTSPYEVQAPPSSDLQTCHNDLNPWNILITENGWVTLDWEFVGNNDPLFDLVNLHQSLALPNDDLWDFAGAYLGGFATDLDERLLHALRSFWIREHGWAEFQLSKGNDRVEIQAQAENAQAQLMKLGEGRLYRG